MKYITNIVESISHNIKNDKIFEILSNTYFEYKKQLQTIKELVVFKQYIKEYKTQKIVVKIDKDNNKEKKELSILQLENQNNK